MARFCASCGAQMVDTAAFCPSCGKATSSSPGVTTAGSAAPARAPAVAQSGASGGLGDNIAGLLCYSPVGLIADIVFLLVEPFNRNPFIRFHAFQSLFLCAAWFVVAIGLAIVSSLLGSLFGPLALLLFPINMIIGLGMLVLCVLMMVKAYQMETPRLPVIGEMAARQAGV
ncbi:MAG: zinc-ribbon domain-containing protein [Terriglobales bacterium]